MKKLIKDKEQLFKSIAIILLVLTIPLIVIITQKQQETRQRASGECTNFPCLQVLDNTNTSLLTTITREVKLRLTFASNPSVNNAPTTSGPIAGTTAPDLVAKSVRSTVLVANSNGNPTIPVGSNIRIKGNIMNNGDVTSPASTARFCIFPYPYPYINGWQNSYSPLHDCITNANSPYKVSGDLAVPSLIKGESSPELTSDEWTVPDQSTDNPVTHWELMLCADAGDAVNEHTTLDNQGYYINEKEDNNCSTMSYITSGASPDLQASYPLTSHTLGSFQLLQGDTVNISAVVRNVISPSPLAPPSLTRMCIYSTTAELNNANHDFIYDCQNSATNGFEDIQTPPLAAGQALNVTTTHPWTVPTAVRDEEYVLVACADVTHVTPQRTMDQITQQWRHCTLARYTTTKDANLATMPTWTPIPNSPTPLPSGVICNSWTGATCTPDQIPQFATRVRYGETETLTGEGVTFTSDPTTISYTLSEGEGQKTIYAEFLVGGNWTNKVSRTIAYAAATPTAMAATPTPTATQGMPTPTNGEVIATPTSGQVTPTPTSGAATITPTPTITAALPNLVVQDVHYNATNNGTADNFTAKIANIGGTEVNSSGIDRLRIDFNNDGTWDDYWTEDMGIQINELKSPNHHEFSDELGMGGYINPGQSQAIGYNFDLGPQNTGKFEICANIDRGFGVKPESNYNDNCTITFFNTGGNPTPTSTVATPTGSAVIAADIDRNGCIDIRDFNIWLGAFRTNTIAANTFPDVDGQDGVTIVDFNIWLSEFRADTHPCQ